MFGNSYKTYDSVMAKFTKAVDELKEVAAARTNKISTLSDAKAKIEAEITSSKAEREKCELTISKFEELLGL